MTEGFHAQVKQREEILTQCSKSEMVARSPTLLLKPLANSIDLVETAIRCMSITLLGMELLLQVGVSLLVCYVFFPIFENLLNFNKMKKGINLKI